jgi:plastocyanin
VTPNFWRSLTAVSLPSIVGNTPRKVVVQRTAATTAKAGAKVSIVNFGFTPTPITIAPGESVVWTNDDGAPHALEYYDGVKGVAPLLPGSSFTRRFDRPGTYEYNCSVHPYMTGRVVVRASDTCYLILSCSRARRISLSRLLFATRP